MEGVDFQLNREIIISVHSERTSNPEIALANQTLTMLDMGITIPYTDLSAKEVELMVMIKQEQQQKTQRDAKMRSMK